MRVIAGPGSGKTKILTSRYVYLVRNVGISSANILCVTFTNKAAYEMKRRIFRAIAGCDLSLICTFHGFCRQFLKDEIFSVNYPSNFGVLDEVDQKQLLRNVYDGFKFKSKDFPYQRLLHDIEERKKETNYLHFLLSAGDDELRAKISAASDTYERIFYGYLHAQKESFGLDFNDLIFLTLHILKNNGAICEKWQKRLEYVMVDEFQDVSPRQYELVSLLSEHHKNLFIVGDPDQTIYSWRGATPKYLLDFDKCYPTTQTIFLNTNYRSTSNILDVANSLISKNQQRIERNLVAVKSDDTRVVYNHLPTEKKEAAWIVDQIKTLIANDIPLNDIAILYRAHYVSRNLEERLVNQKIPYMIYSGVNFYERMEVKDILSYLKFLLHKDDLCFMRIINLPRRNIGKKRIDFLKDYAILHNCSLYQALQENANDKLFVKTKANEFIELIEKYSRIYKNLSISLLLNDLINDSGYSKYIELEGDHERLNNIAELKQSILEYESIAGEDTTLADYLQDISLLTNTDRKEKAANSVKLMTIHAAKGLEFPCVFVCSMSEGIFPSRKSEGAEELEEERRLAFVAFTRAEKLLFLSDSAGFNFDHTFKTPSRFIFDIDKKFLDYKTELDPQLISAMRSSYVSSERRISTSATAKTSFKVGDRVRHKHFGDGMIVKIDRQNHNYLILFDIIQAEKAISKEWADYNLQKLD